MFNYQLEENELFYLHDTAVEVAGTITCKNASLLLTSKNLIVEYETGFIKKKKFIEKFPLHELLQHNGIPQISVERTDEEDEESKVLVIVFSNAKLYFRFLYCDDIDEYIVIWTNNIIRTFQDLSLSVENKTDIVCPSCGQKVFENAEFCTNCGSKLKKESIIEGQTLANNGISLDQQIELLKKLKSLVEAGAITEEEFELKKREIFK